MEDAPLHLSVDGLNAIYPCGCLSGSFLLALSPEVYHVIMKLLTSSSLHLQLPFQCLYGLFVVFDEAEVVGVVRLWNVLRFPHDGTRLRSTNAPVCLKTVWYTANKIFFLFFCFLFLVFSVRTDVI